MRSSLPYSHRLAHSTLTQGWVATTMRGKALTSARQTRLTSPQTSGVWAVGFAALFSGVCIRTPTGFTYTSDLRLRSTLRSWANVSSPLSGLYSRAQLVAATGWTGERGMPFLLQADLLHYCAQCNEGSVARGSACI